MLFNALLDVASLSEIAKSSSGYAAVAGSSTERGHVVIDEGLRRRRDPPWFSRQRGNQLLWTKFTDPVAIQEETIVLGRIGENLRRVRMGTRSTNCRSSCAELGPKSGGRVEGQAELLASEPTLSVDGKTDACSVLRVRSPTTIPRVQSCTQLARLKLPTAYLPPCRTCFSGSEQFCMRTVLSTTWALQSL